MRFILLFAAVSLFGQTPTPFTQTTTTSLPPIGLAPTETAQVNVANSAPLSPTGVVSYCTGSVAFYDANGTIIGRATDFKVANGQIMSVKLPYASAGAGGASRVVVRAEISITTPSTVAYSGTTGAAG